MVGRSTFAALLGAALLSAPAGATPPPPPKPVATNPGEQIPGPPNPADAAGVALWRAALEQWRAKVLASIHYNGSIYDEPALTWTQTSYIQPQMHPYDRYFFDGKNYTVKRWLDDVDKRYGGVDSMLMWPTYTNIGADARSQFDLFSAMPGGLPGVRAAVDELHAAGVKVLLPYNPWDTGTRRVPLASNRSNAATKSACYRYGNVTLSKCATDGHWITYTKPTDPGSLVWTEHMAMNCYGGHGATPLEPIFAKSITLIDCEAACALNASCSAIVVPFGGSLGLTPDAYLLDDLIKEVDADGFNGDTMGSVPESFYTTSQELGHPVAIEPEGGGQASLGFANWDTMVRCQCSAFGSCAGTTRQPVGAHRAGVTGSTLSFLRSTPGSS